MRLDMKNLLIISGITLALSACTNTQTIPADAGDPNNPNVVVEPAPGFAQYKGLPIPANAGLDLKNSLILGSGENWMGRLQLTSGHSMQSLIDFYLAEMPKLGWRELTTRRKVTATLTFDRHPRIASVKIKARGSSKSDVIITVSPKSNYGR
jgi:hypothetical protein